MSEKKNKKINRMTAYDLDQQIVRFKGTNHEASKYYRELAHEKSRRVRA